MSFGDGNLHERVEAQRARIETLMETNGALCAEINRQEARIRELTAERKALIDSNVGFGPESGVSDQDGGSNVACMAQDSREKLEKDLKTRLYEFGGYCFSSREEHTDNVDTFFDEFVSLLDRQAAITERELEDVFLDRAEIIITRREMEKRDLQQQVDELKAERDGLRSQLARIREVVDE